MPSKTGVVLGAIATPTNAAWATLSARPRMARERRRKLRLLHPTSARSMIAV